MRVLVTGASGFVGRATCRRLEELGHPVRAAVRSADRSVDAASECVSVGEIGPGTVWEPFVREVDVVIHLAARVHMMEDRAADPLAAFRLVNTAGTLALAEAAADAAVRRFVFVSSIKVNGEETRAGRPFTERDPPGPVDPYGQSKWEAEQALGDLSRRTGMEVCVVRPPLVYGPGVRANFLRLLQAVARGLPLPLGGLTNRRSILFVDNLADALATCAFHPAAAGETFLVADEPSLTPPELIRSLAAALGRRPRLVPVPASLMQLAGRVTGREAAVQRLCGTLEIDPTHIRTTLDWTQPFSTEAGLERTARWYREDAPGVRRSA
jgi:nucleoside-diphosphate-sugar epimerase